MCERGWSISDRQRLELEFGKLKSLSPYTHGALRFIPIGLRNLVELAGGASTKPHPRFATAQVVITMRDIMCDKALIAALGPLGDRLSLLIATLYADPRA